MTFEEWHQDLLATEKHPIVNILLIKDLLHRAYDAGYYCSESKKENKNTNGSNYEKRMKEIITKNL